MDLTKRSKAGAKVVATEIQIGECVRVWNKVSPALVLAQSERGT